MLIKALAAAAGNFGVAGYDIANSLRFNDDDSAYLSRTPSVAGNRKTWTWSGWVKRGNTGSISVLFAASNESTTQGYIGFRSDDTVTYFDYVSTSNVNVATNAVLRDSSGWYHIVVVFDTTQATGSDRVKFYINGVDQATTYTLTPSLNYEGSINTTGAHGIGREEFGNTYYFDGYMAEINFIDGQALTADDFGEINEDTGEWSPKKYSGTYGTNGFYLEFKDGAALGDDTSGNTNDWTPTNLASTDQMLDTPTNNFSVLNPLQGYSFTYSEGNLKCVTNDNTTSVGSVGACSMPMPDQGKWYSEYTVTAFNAGNLMIGIVDSEDTNAVTGSQRVYDLSSAYVMYANDGAIYNGGSSTPYGSSYGVGDILGVAYDADSGSLYFYKNGTIQNSGTAAVTGLSGSNIFTFTDDRPSGSSTFVANFGQDSSFAGNKTRQGNTDASGKGDFYYTPPTGYLALCTDNLAEPAIVDSESQFNVVTYTGDGNTGRAITGVGFQPDFVWYKDRTSANNHHVFDSVRGAGNYLFTSATNAEATDTNRLTSFDADGFTIGSAAGTNYNGNNYVAWCWKAGGTAVTNNDGTTSSLVSANVDAGFSIVAWNSVGSGQTLGHGLSAVPQIVITKKRNSANNWVVQANYLDATSYYLYLQSTAANVGAFGNAATDTVFDTITGTGGDSYISYVFAPKEGFSKFGLYVGNGSTNGPFVYTGFRPAFVIYKRAIGGTGNWNLADNKREGYNWDNPALYPNLTNAESSGSSLDLLSNGFKINNAVAGSNHNASGSTYIYMAFAEAPFKEALAR